MTKKTKTAVKEEIRQDLPLPAQVEKLLLPHANHFYYFDLNHLVDMVAISDKEGVVMEINAPKYEIYKLLIDIVTTPIDSDDDSDPTLDAINMKKNTPFDFKLAYNTLVKDQIIKTYE